MIYHWNEGEWDASNPNYSGTLWIPVPPLIMINNTGKDYWINHSTYITAGYNDSLW